MRISDARKHDHMSRAVSNVTMVARADIKASPLLSGIFLRGISYELKELELLGAGRIIWGKMNPS